MAAIFISIKCGYSFRILIRICCFSVFFSERIYRCRRLLTTWMRFRSKIHWIPKTNFQNTNKFWGNDKLKLQRWLISRSWLKKRVYFHKYFMWKNKTILFEVEMEKDKKRKILFLINRILLLMKAIMTTKSSNKMAF